MFDLLCIFTGSGLVLWHQGVAWHPLNVLISQVLLQERTHMPQFTFGSYIMKWTLVPKFDLVIAAVYQQMFPLVLVEEFLENMKYSLLKLIENKTQAEIKEVIFDEQYQLLYEKWQEKCRENTKRPEPTDIYPTFLPPQKSDVQTPAKSKTKEKRSPDKKKSSKVFRIWDVDSKVTNKKIESLDMSSNKSGPAGGKAIYLQGAAVSDESESEEEEKRESGFLSRISNTFKGFAGNKELLDEDLEPVLRDFKDILIRKNVAEEISQQLCDSISNTLVHTKTASFTSVSATVKVALKNSLEKLLTPKQSIDVLRDALVAKTRNQPYVIVFCGVNGVGKSTSLAKVAYYLKTKGNLSIMIAACDTFRAGAVEQVRTHANTLDIPLFEQGYGKEPGNVAREAIKSAKQRGIDVVLVDTAGRMQHNESLMQALATLVNINKPDLVLFVGEALVGNDGVDQLATFNRALTDKTEDGRGVDGILLTKFDTVDDKVGAALSMVYSTGKPIVFIGVGERYGHLKRLHVSSVVSSLLA